jgi:capsular polysaccharide biosynthesis protein
MNVIVFVIGAAVIIVGAIALGMKFFDTSVKEQEDERGWDE